MSKVVSLVRREPVRVYLWSVLASGVGLLQAFGVNLTGAQTGALLGFAAVVLGVGEIVRGHVTPGA